MPPTLPRHPNAMLGRHLGRKPPTDEQRKKFLPLRPFVKLIGRPVPTTDDYATKAQDALTKMMDNDAEGCCVITALAKLIGMENAYRPGGSVVVATDREVSRAYHDVGGPGDNGLYSPDALDWLRDKGMVFGGKLHKIEGYAAFDPTDPALTDAAFHWFGGLYFGVNLTSRQYNHAEDTDTWDIDGTGVVGGHAIPFSMRFPDKCQLATWARQPVATRRLMQSRNWADEAFVVLGPDWFNAAGIDTNNVNVSALRDALAAVKAGGTPSIPTDPNPPPNPPPGPVGPGNIHLTGTVQLFSEMLPCVLDGTLDPAILAAAFPASVSTWVIVIDVLNLVTAFRAGDWAAFAVALAKLESDLGFTFSEYQRLQVARAVMGKVLPLTP